jgi:hypothetical protein
MIISNRNNHSPIMKNAGRTPASARCEHFHAPRDIAI